MISSQLTTTPLSHSVGILAIGTELTDGQTLNTNAAWISERLVNQGYRISEHLTIPDDRKLILDHLRALQMRCGILFVTGGLGPTSDDFTREVIAEWIGVKLLWNEESWNRIVARLTRFAIPIAEANRQQCYFPEGSEILSNSQGTADGFTFVHECGARVFVLPGPPLEIQAVWQAHVPSVLARRPIQVRPRQLKIWKCMGQSEARLGEMVESTLQETGLERGYRAHAPYVEIKVWFPGDMPNQQVQVTVDRLEESLSAWIVARDDEDLAERFVRAWPSHPICLEDTLSGVYLTDRIWKALEKCNDPLQPVERRFQILSGTPGTEIKRPHSQSSDELYLVLKGDLLQGTAQVQLAWTGFNEETLIQSPYRRAGLENRNRKFLGELALRWWTERITHASR